MSFLIRKTTNCNSHARETLNTSTFHVNYPTKKPWLPQKYTQQQPLDAFRKKKPHSITLEPNSPLHLTNYRAWTVRCASLVSLMGAGRAIRAAAGVKPHPSWCPSLAFHSCREILAAIMQLLISYFLPLSGAPCVYEGTAERNPSAQKLKGARSAPHWCSYLCACLFQHLSSGLFWQQGAAKHHPWCYSFQHTPRVGKWAVPVLKVKVYGCVKEQHQQPGSGFPRLNAGKSDLK